MEPDPLYSAFGRLVRKHRERLGLTQDQLSQRVGLSRTSITNIERGRQKVLLHQVFMLAESLEANPEALLPTLQAGQRSKRLSNSRPVVNSQLNRPMLRGNR